jgi:RimJ/RimL family protein N-acetyltransferase
MSSSDVSLKDLHENLLPLVHTWFNDPVAFGDFDRPHPLQWDEFKKKWDEGGYKTTRILFQAEEPIGWARYFVSDKKPWICGMSLFITLPNKRGQGLGALALRALMQEISEAYPDVCKFEVLTDINNKAAQAMFEKLGFEQEGLFKRYWKLQGKFSDMYSYALLK